MYGINRHVDWHKTGIKRQYCLFSIIYGNKKNETKMLSMGREVEVGGKVGGENSCRDDQYVPH